MHGCTGACLCKWEELLSDPTVYDIILLDISLNRKPDSGKPNGMEVAKKIRKPPM